ncbi:MAG: HD domain-containing protein [Methyloprofundus sp.]|nr:HD domain-containing protein [Methyloprofundus sp.]
MNKWNQDSYLKAWNYACYIHNGQYLPSSDIPYINHIGLVAMEAAAAIANTPDTQQPDLLISCALLHDAIEDTATTYTEIQENFGTAIAEGVLALSKNKALPTKAEQMQDSLERIKQQPKEIWMVKLCDRITNLQPPPAHWNQAKSFAYQEEARLILEQLGESSEFLSARLSMKIHSYSQYV